MSGAKTFDKNLLLQILDELSEEQAAEVFTFALFIRDRFGAAFDESRSTELKTLPAARLQALLGTVAWGETLSKILSVFTNYEERRAEEQKRSEQFSMLLDKLLMQVPIDDITWISSEIQRLYQKTIEQVRQTEGALNFHDALMALYCQEYEIKAIISFDRDFDRISWLKRVAAPEDVKTVFYFSK
ncbi:MAG: type II toxin-antitoxin system VapC family toxin [Anaerolineales bacterium]